MKTHIFVKFIRSFSIFILIILPLLLMADFSKLFDPDYPDKKGEVCKIVSPTGENYAQSKKLDFLNEQYKTSTQEIRNRLEHEHLLFALRFTIVGAMLALIFNTAKSPNNRKWKNEYYNYLQGFSLIASIGWAAVAVSAVIDVRATFNAEMISIVGSWIRCVEPLFMFEKIQGWETYLDNTWVTNSSNVDVKNWLDAMHVIIHALLRMDRPLLTWVLYVMVLYFFVIVPAKFIDFEKNGKTDLQDVFHGFSFRLARWAVTGCYLLFGLSGYYPYANKQYPAGIIYAATVFLAIILAITLIRPKFLSCRDLLPDQQSHDLDT